jgi:hypothetical protein
MKLMDGERATAKGMQAVSCLPTRGPAVIFAYVMKFSAVDRGPAVAVRPRVGGCAPAGRSRRCMAAVRDCVAKHGKMGGPLTIMYLQAK